MDMTYKEIYENRKMLKSQGLTDKEIAEQFAISERELRRINSFVSMDERTNKMIEIFKLKDKGYSNRAIGKKLGINESSIRRLIEESNKLYYFDIVLENRIKQLHEDGYGTDYISTTIGIDEPIVRWILFKEEFVTPTILSLAETLIKESPTTNEYSIADLYEKVVDRIHDPLVDTDMIIYILEKAGYTVSNNCIGVLVFY